MLQLMTCRNKMSKRIHPCNDRTPADLLERRQVFGWRVLVLNQGSELLGALGNPSAHRILCLEQVRIDRLLRQHLGAKPKRRMGRFRRGACYITGLRTTSLDATWRQPLGWEDKQKDKKNELSHQRHDDKCPKGYVPSPTLPARNTHHPPLSPCLLAAAIPADGTRKHRTST